MFTDDEFINMKDILDPIEDDDDIDWKHNPFDVDSVDGMESNWCLRSPSKDLHNFRPLLTRPSQFVATMDLRFQNTYESSSIEELGVVFQAGQRQRGEPSVGDLSSQLSLRVVSMEASKREAIDHWKIERAHLKHELTRVQVAEGQATQDRDEAR